jgi:hypothetical protein
MSTYADRIKIARGGVGADVSEPAKSSLRAR